MRKKHPGCCRAARVLESNRPNTRQLLNCHLEMQLTGFGKHVSLLIHGFNILLGVPAALVCGWKFAAGLSIGGTLAGWLALGLTAGSVYCFVVGRRIWRSGRKWPAIGMFAAAGGLAASAVALVVSTGWIAVGVNLVLTLGLVSLVAASYVSIRGQALGYRWMRASLIGIAAVAVPSAIWSYGIGLADPLSKSSTLEFGSYLAVAGWSIIALVVSGLPAFKRVGPA